MVIELPDSILAKTSISEQNIKLLLAITLFREELLTLGEAASLADLPQLIFQKELAKRKIPMHYGIEELKQDLRHLSPA